MNLVCWLHDWQELTAGVLGALMLAGTVAVTLSSEKRRRRADTEAFRIALGAEIRQLGAAALNAYRAVADILAQLGGSKAGITRKWLAAQCQLPDPVVYPNNADKIGSLGHKVAFEVVFFYGQLALLADSVRVTVASVSEDAGGVAIRWQIVNNLKALLTAAKAAVDALPAFSSDTWNERDAEFSSRVSLALEELKALEQPAR